MKTASIATAHATNSNARLDSVHARQSHRRSARTTARRSACHMASVSSDSHQQQISELQQENRQLEEIIEALERRTLELEAQLANQW